MGQGLQGKTERSDRKRRIFLEIGFLHGRVRRRRVNIKWHVEVDRALKDRPEPLVVHEAAVGQPHDHGAPEAKLAHGALQLVSRRCRIGRRQSSKAGKPVWVPTHGFVQHIVGGARELDGCFRVEILGRRIILGNDLQIDPGFVHFTDTQFAKVIELALNRRILLAAQCAQFRRREVLLERDDLGRRHDEPSSATASISILKP